MTWTHNGAPIGPKPRPWRLTRRQRVEMEAALAGFRARIVASPRRVDRLRDSEDIEDAPLTPGWGQTVPVEPGCVFPTERAIRVARARVAIALRAALRADEDARCEELYAEGHRRGTTMRVTTSEARSFRDGAAIGWTVAVNAGREWPGVRRGGLGLVPLALWEVDGRRRRETVRVVVALVQWGLS